MSSATSLNLASVCTSVVNFPTHFSHKPSLLLHGTQFSQSPNNTLFKNCSWKLSRPTKRAVAAVDSSDPAEKQETERKKYYFLVANAKFMLDEEEHFQEQMFERRRLYGERNKEPDFWLVIEPKFLDKFPNITKRLKRPAVALVSTNGPWITFMKLRLDRVLQESYEADSIEEALACTPVSLEFEKPDKWTAPYPKYDYGWWESFLPPGSQTSKFLFLPKVIFTPPSSSPAASRVAAVELSRRFPRRRRQYPCRQHRRSRPSSSVACRQPNSTFLHLRNQSNPFLPRLIYLGVILVTASEMDEKRAKRLCFLCDEKYVQGHNCRGKKQFYLVEV